MWGRSLNGKGFVQKYARKRHALQATAVDNCSLYYEINEENKGEEFKCNDFEILILTIFTICIIQS
jgi:hypothetical protein